MEEALDSHDQMASLSIWTGLRIILLIANSHWKIKLVKHRMILGMIILFSITFLNHKGHADVLIYGDAVIYSIRHSANLRMKIEDIHIYDAVYRMNFAGLYPSINLSGRAERFENIDTRNRTNIDIIGNEVVGGNQSVWRSSMSLTGQYYFSHWYKKRFEAAYYEKLKDSNIHQYGAEVKKILRDVTEIYGVLAETKIKLNYSIQIMQRLNEILKIKKEAFPVGQFSYEEILKAEADTIDLQRDIEKTRKELSETFIKLSGYTGTTYSEDTEIEQLLVSGQIPIIDETRVIAETPEYKARLKEMEAIRSKEKAARNSFLPDISIYGRYDLFNSSLDSLGTSIRDTRPSSYSAGILVNMSIFDGGAKKWERRKNLYEIRKQEESIRATFEEKNKDINMLRAGHDGLIRSYHHYKKLHEQYEKMMDISKKAYSLGERSKVDMLEMEKDALTVERDLKVTEQSVAIYEKQIALETDYNKFMRDYDGNRACKY